MTWIGVPCPDYSDPWLVRWNVVVCQSNRERQLAEALTLAGYGAIAPTYTAWKIRHLPVGSRHEAQGGRWFKRERTLIPHYVLSTVTAEELHPFKGDGAIRVPPGSAKETARFLSAIFTDWAAGTYNDPEPDGLKPKPAPIKARNRKTRRAAQARREALDWTSGLLKAREALDGPVHPFNLAA